MSGERTAEILLETKVVTLSPLDPYTYTSGILSPIYCNNRRLISLPDERDRIVEGFIDLIGESSFDVVAGTESAGIPWSSYVGDRLRKPNVYVKKAQKEHGLKNLVEGILEQDQITLVTEDLISTGGSSIAVVKAIREAGGIVNDCYAIFTYELQKSIDSFEEAVCRLHTLTNFTTLVDVALSSNYIDEQEREIYF